MLKYSNFKESASLVVITLFTEKCSALPEHTCIITEESGSAEHKSWVAPSTLSEQLGCDHSETRRLFSSFNFECVIQKFAKSDSTKSCTRSADSNERILFQLAHSTRSSSR